ncbi:hypothetical protein QRE62_03325 (plasmid) [Bacillus mycoides]|uniref:Lipoprotein n=3 Tax=Bacillus TaxID=1386 RepID=A0A2A8LUM2_BACCE|nr:hypothetical protein [Bacillus mycoides]PES99179.1 hypothetical protein CN491_02520 [Bacillus cereus]PGT13447.1 hypothetical protein COC96_23400 [Bacillus cereus]WJE74048.1 hypothetical protein QRE62_03325 [Bacillus mycoides]
MKKIFISFSILIILLSGCKTTSIEGSWDLAEKQDNDCPIYYKFKTTIEKEKKEPNKKKIVEMYTDSKKGELYQGTYVNDFNMYYIDYGNSFTSNQSIRNVDGYLKVYFENVNKICTYENNNK